MSIGLICVILVGLIVSSSIYDSIMLERRRKKGKQTDEITLNPEVQQSEQPKSITDDKKKIKKSGKYGKKLFMGIMSHPIEKWLLAVTAERKI